jgi:hypothetical protein
MLVNNDADRAPKVAVVVPMKSAPVVAFVVNQFVAVGGSLVRIITGSPALHDLDHRTRRPPSVRQKSA